MFRDSFGTAYSVVSVFSQHENAVNSEDALKEKLCVSVKVRFIINKLSKIRWLTNERKVCFYTVTHWNIYGEAFFNLPL